MARVSTALLPLVFFTLVSVAVPATSYSIYNICQQSKNPNFCTDLLQPRSGASLQDLDQFVLDTTSSAIKDTQDKIQSLLSKTNERDMRLVYYHCFMYYGDAQGALNSAKEQLKSGKYRDVASAASTVAAAASKCYGEFSYAKHPVLIGAENARFDFLSDVFVVVSRALPN